VPGRVVASVAAGLRAGSRRRVGSCRPPCRVASSVAGTSPANPSERPTHGERGPASMTLRIYREFLPHWRLEGAVYFVTWRLRSSQPALSGTERSLVQRALLHAHGQQFDLLAYVVMDDHVHAIVRPNPGVFLETVIHSWRSFTTHQLQRTTGREGRIWQHDYFDRIVRDQAELAEKMRYVLSNPWRRWPEIEGYEWVGAGTIGLHLLPLRMRRPGTEAGSYRCATADATTRPGTEVGSYRRTTTGRRDNTPRHGGRQLPTHDDDRRDSTLRHGGRQLPTHDDRPRDNTPRHGGRQLPTRAGYSLPHESCERARHRR